MARGVVSRWEERRWRPSHLWALSPALLTVVIVLVGQLFARSGRAEPNGWAGLLVWLLFLSHIPLALLLWRHLRSVRWGSMMASALFGVSSLIALWVAGMEISGDWI